MKLDLKKRDDRIFLAGVIDKAKGSIGLLEGYASVSLRTQTSYLKELKKQIGGTIFRYHGLWVYRVTGKRAIRLLKLVEPFLREKKRMARKLLKKAAKRVG